MANNKEGLDLLIKIAVENVQALNKLTGEFEKTGKELENLNKKSAEGGESNESLIASLAGVTAKLGPYIAAFTAAGAALGTFFGQTRDLAVKLADTNEQIENAGKSSGATAETLTALGLAAEEAGIGGLSTATIGLNRLRKAQDEAAQGAKENLTALNRLAGGAADLNDVNILFEQIAKNVTATGGAAKSAADIVKVFGRTALADIGPLLDGFEKAKTRADEFGILIKGKVADSAAALDSQLDELNSRIKGVSLTTGGEFAEAFEAAARAANELIEVLSKDEDFVRGLKEAAKFGSIVIEVTLKPLIALAGKAAEAVAGIGNLLKGTADAIKDLGAFIESRFNRLFGTELVENFFGFLKLQLGILPEAAEPAVIAVEEVTESVEELGRQLVITTGKVPGLTKALAELDKENQRFIKGLEANAKGNKQDLENLANDGVITFEKASKKIGEIDDQLSDARIRNAENVLARVKEKFTEQEAIAKELLDQIATREKTALLTGIGDLTEFAEQRKKISASLAAFEFSNREDLQNAELALDQAKADRKVQDAQKEKNLLAGIVKDRETSLKRIDQAETLALNKLQQRLTELALNVTLSDAERLRQTEQIEKERLATVNEFAQKRVDAEQNAVNRIKKENITLADGIFEANKKLSDGLIKLSKSTADQRIEEAKREAEATKRIAEAGKKFNDQLLEEIKLRQQNISLGTAARDKQRAELNEIRDAKRDAGQGDVDAIRNAEELARATSDVGIATAEVNARLRETQEQFQLAFDPERLDLARDKIVELQGRIEEFTAAINRFGFSAIIDAARQSAQQAIDDIQRKIDETLRENTRKQAEEAARIREENARKAAAALLEIETNLQKELADLERDERQTRRKAEKETEAQQNSAAADRIEAAEDLAATLLEIEQDRLKREAEAQQRADDERKERAIETEAAIRKTKEDAAQDALDIQIEAESELARIQNEIDEKLKERGRVGITPEEQQRIDAEIKALRDKAAGISSSADKERERAERKAAAIALAIKESATKEEADIRISAIEQEFKDEEDLDKALEGLDETRNAAAIASIKALFEEKKRLRDIATAAALADQKALADLEQQQRDRDRQAEIDAHNDRLQDAKDAYQKEIEAINTRNGAALFAIGDRLAKELQAIKDQRKKVEDEAAAQAAKILSTFMIARDAVGAFLKSAGDGYSELLKLLDKIAAKQDEITENTKKQTGDDSSSNRTFAPTGNGSRSNRGSAPAGSSATAQEQAARAASGPGAGRTPAQLDAIRAMLLEALGVSGSFSGGPSATFTGGGGPREGTITPVQEGTIVVNNNFNTTAMVDRVGAELRQKLPQGILEVQRQIREQLRKTNSLRDRGGFLRPAGRRIG